jgi:hypothetical protein
VPRFVAYNQAVTNASRGLRANPRWEDDGETLVLEGHIVDAITRLSVRAVGQDGDYRFRDVGEEDADDSEATKTQSLKGNRRFRRARTG